MVVVTSTRSPTGRTSPTCSPPPGCGGCGWPGRAPGCGGWALLLLRDLHDAVVDDHAAAGDSDAAGGEPAVDDDAVRQDHLVAIRRGGDDRGAAVAAADDMTTDNLQHVENHYFSWVASTLLLRWIVT